jgi:hypothetical protein
MLRALRPCRNVSRICARIAAVLRVMFLAVAYAVILLPPNALPISTRTAFLAAFLLVSAAHLLLAAVASVSRRGPAAGRRTYGLEGAPQS